MIEQSNEKARLSGWVRLWIVCAVISWVLGGLDVSLSIETFQWPLPISELTPQSVRHLMWFLGPIILAAAWSSIRWVWLGFHPSAELAVAPDMSATEIATRAFRLAKRVIGFIIGLIAIGLIAVFGFVTTEDMETREFSDTWWGWLLVSVHMFVVAWIVLSIWEWITQSSDD